MKRGRAILQPSSDICEELSDRSLFAGQNESGYTAKGICSVDQAREEAQG
jgi:hypothetical protein